MKVTFFLLFLGASSALFSQESSKILENISATLDGEVFTINYSYNWENWDDDGEEWYEVEDYVYVGPPAVYYSTNAGESYFKINSITGFTKLNRPQSLRWNVADDLPNGLNSDEIMFKVVEKYKVKWFTKCSNPNCGPGSKSSGGWLSEPDCGMIKDFVVCPTCQGECATTNTSEIRKAEVISGVISSNSKKVYRKKLALVIGNSNYQNCSSLPNAVNDASLIKDKLQNLGYEVYYKEDCDLSDFQSYLSAFENDLINYELGFFYYAGHAFEDEKTGINYMVPTNAPSPSSSSLPTSCFPLSKVTSVLSNGNNDAFVVVFDACRDVPGRTVTAKTPLNRGMKTVPSVSNKTKEYVIIFSAGPGEVATDGDGHNSPFTKTLADQLIPSKRLGVSDLFRKIRQKVTEITKQNPMLINSSSDFSL